MYLSRSYSRPLCILHVPYESGFFFPPPLEIVPPEFRLYALVAVSTWCGFVVKREPVTCCSELTANLGGGARLREVLTLPFQFFLFSCCALSEESLGLGLEVSRACV